MEFCTSLEVITPEGIQTGYSSFVYIKIIKKGLKSKGFVKWSDHLSIV